MASAGSVSFEPCAGKEAIENVREAIALTVEDMRARGEPIPDPDREIHLRVAAGQ